MPSCAIKGCKSNATRKVYGVRFHRFPLDDPDLCQKWIDATGRSNWKPKKHSRICSLHFNKYTNSKYYWEAGFVPEKNVHNNSSNDSDSKSDIFTGERKLCVDPNSVIEKKPRIHLDEHTNQRKLSSYTNAFVLQKPCSSMIQNIPRCSFESTSDASMSVKGLPLEPFAVVLKKPYSSTTENCSNFKINATQTVTKGDPLDQNDETQKIACQTENCSIFKINATQTVIKGDPLDQNDETQKIACQTENCSIFKINATQTIIKREPVDQNDETQKIACQENVLHCLPAVHSNKHPSELELTRLKKKLEDVEKISKRRLLTLRAVRESRRRALKKIDHLNDVIKDLKTKLKESSETVALLSSINTTN